MLAVEHPPVSGNPDVFARHGGQLSAARAIFPEAPEPWLDLSTGINPHAYPVGDVSADAWRRLPDPADEAALVAAARRCYGAPDNVELIAAPGTQALIQRLPQVMPARRVVIWGFGYQEHPASWRAAGAAVTVTARLDDLADADVGVVVNPNNPDGRHAAPEHLHDLAARMSRRGGTLIVDEAFADASPTPDSVVPLLPAQGVLVLRSFGKFYGLAGLRLGFAVGDVALCRSLRAGLGPWAVSGPALTVATRALADRVWQETTRTRLASDARRLDQLLGHAGCTVVGGTPLFRLIRHRTAPALFDRLGRGGILVRPFAHDPTWLRFGLPGCEANWLRLVEALAVHW